MSTMLEASRVWSRSLTYDNISPELKDQLNALGAEELGPHRAWLANFLIGTSLTCITYGILLWVLAIWVVRQVREAKQGLGEWLSRAFMVLLFAAATTYTAVTLAHTTLLFSDSFGQYYAFYLSDWKATPLMLAVLIQILVTMWMAGRFWVCCGTNHPWAWLIWSIVTVCVALTVTFRIRVPEVVLEVTSRDLKDLKGMLGSLLVFDLIVALATTLQLRHEWGELSDVDFCSRTCLVLLEIQAVPTILAGVMISTIKDFSHPHFAAILLFVPHVAILNLMLAVLNPRDLLWLNRRYRQTRRLELPPGLPSRLIHVETEVMVLEFDTSKEDGLKVSINRDSIHTPRPGPSDFATYPPPSLPYHGDGSPYAPSAEGVKEGVTTRIIAGRPQTFRQSSFRSMSMADHGLAHMGTMGVAFGLSDPVPGHMPAPAAGSGNGQASPPKGRPGSAGLLATRGPALGRRIRPASAGNPTGQLGAATDQAVTFEQKKAQRLRPGSAGAAVERAEQPNLGSDGLPPAGTEAHPEVRREE